MQNLSQDNGKQQSEKHKCKLCNYASDRTRNVRRHVEKKQPQKVVMEKMEYYSTVDEAQMLCNLRQLLSNYIHRRQSMETCKMII